MKTPELVLKMPRLLFKIVDFAIFMHSDSKN